MASKTAFFRFEASPTIGAGHAIRSSVLADALIEKGWNCKIVTLETSYGFIKNLERCERVDPDVFFEEKPACDLLVIDSYDFGEEYEKHFRDSAKKIMVIDDLANRKHDCDILLDQTYGREAHDYKGLVPESCKILAGSDYVLLRKEFIELRPKALEKRRETKEIKRILISMGGSDPHNFTLKALQMVKDSGFKGVLDVVLGFAAPHYSEVEDFLKHLPNESSIHINPNMAQLTYDADLAIGAAGSSVWERCCLGLASLLMKTAGNQDKIYESMIEGGFGFNNINFGSDLKNIVEISIKCSGLIDGNGTRTVTELVA
jgi:UDP-2,4-diacetamido-2,4,6-trideoxy-beta-L-altropyranose hydrolase